MTDEEITKLCAEAMGLKVTEVYWAGKKEKGLELVDEYDFQFDCRLCYDPLHNDAQAMALVKMFRLAIGNDEDVWYVCPDRPFEEVDDRNLNRAICRLVAYTQKERNKNRLQPGTS